MDGAQALPRPYDSRHRRFRWPSVFDSWVLICTEVVPSVMVGRDPVTHVKR